MADIIPFRAVRPRADLADRIAALPYDVYNRKEAREAVKGDDYTYEKPVLYHLRKHFPRLLIYLRRVHVIPFRELRLRSVYL